MSGCVRISPIDAAQPAVRRAAQRLASGLMQSDSRRAADNQPDCLRRFAARARRSLPSTVKRSASSDVTARNGTAAPSRRPFHRVPPQPSNAREKQNDKPGSGALAASEGAAARRSRRGNFPELVCPHGPGRIDDGTAHLSVPTRFLKSWIQSHYIDRVLACWQAEDPTCRRSRSACAAR